MNTAFLNAKMISWLQPSVLMKAVSRQEQGKQVSGSRGKSDDRKAKWLFLWAVYRG